jgi:hypothetical protein
VVGKLELESRTQLHESEDSGHALSISEIKVRSLARVFIGPPATGSGQVWSSWTIDT